MIQSIQKNVIRLQTGHPGRRFHDFYEYRQNQRSHRWTFASAATIIGGLLIAGLGIVLIPAPGPGAMIVLLGLALLGSEFEFIARFLDWAERTLRPSYEWAKKFWLNASFGVRIAVGITGLILGAIALYVGYQLFFAK